MRKKIIRKIKFTDRFFSIIFLLIPSTWAGSFIAGKYVVADVDPIPSVFFRFLLSAFLMLPGLLLFHRHRHPPIMKKTFQKHLIIVVLTAGIGYHILFFWALKYTSPTDTALIIALNPFFTALGEIIFLRKTRTTRFYAGFILAFAGAIWVNLSRGGGFKLTLPGLGEALCLGASLCWSIYTITAKLTKHPQWDPLWINAYNYLFTALLMLPFMGRVLTMEHLKSISYSAWTGLWYMAIFPTAIGYTFYYIGIQKKGPAWAATFIYIVPSITAGLDHLFFKAILSLPMILGTTLVVLGLLIGNLNLEMIRIGNGQFNNSSRTLK